MDSPSNRVFLKRLLLTGAVQGTILATVMWCLNRIMNGNSHQIFRKKIAGREVRLTQSEHDLLDSVCEADEITEDFSAIGGLHDIKDTVRRSVVLPFQHPEMYPLNSLRSPPKGVLLYGPPGTGKTLVAKAIARSCGATFIEVRVESLFGKWLGQSEQAVAAIFSLARKVSPCIIFVDELDSLLSRRDYSDNHAYSNAKTIFLRQWDGFATRERQHQVVVVGATNCPEVLDSAVLRRLPVKLKLELPAKEERLEILQILLAGEDLTSTDLHSIAARTRNYSGSDLKELCKQALLSIVQDAILKKEQSGKHAHSGSLPAKLDTACFLRSLPIVGANADFTSQLNVRMSSEEFYDIQDS